MRIEENGTIGVFRFPRLNDINELNVGTSLYTDPAAIFAVT